MAKLGIDAEVYLRTGKVAEAVKELQSGLKSHGVEMTGELEGFLCDWLKCRTIVSVGSRVGSLARRLAVYECVDHESSRFGECDACDFHNPDREMGEP